jgi:hypothetical protein
MDVLAEVIGDRARDRRRTVHRGQDADVVARRDAPVGPADAHEGGRRIDELGRVHAGRRRVVAREAAELEVVRVHMLAGGDRLFRGADDLVVAPHRRALRNRTHRDLVAGRHQADHGDAFARDRRAADELLARDHDVVGGMDADHERVGDGGHGAAC